MNSKPVAIMQPYIFPYIGYFHLINASENFVFYDDVSFISRGWINRNQIFNNGNSLLFTVPVEKINERKLIIETRPVLDPKWRNKFSKQLKHCYGKAPFFNVAIEPIMAVFDQEYASISDLCISSISSIYSYLGNEFSYLKSSEKFPESRDLKKADRLINITKKLKSDTYVNAAGGKALYSKAEFLQQGIKLKFIKSELTPYQQGKNKFIPGLSIIDTIMFCSREAVAEMFCKYSLE